MASGVTSHLGVKVCALSDVYISPAVDSVLTFATDINFQDSGMINWNFLNINKILFKCFKIMISDQNNKQSFFYAKVVLKVLVYFISNNYIMINMVYYYEPINCDIIM
jgi:hypothetical protein